MREVLEIKLIDLEGSMDSEDQVKLLDFIQDNYAELSPEQKGRLHKWLNSHVAPLPLIRRRLGPKKYKKLVSSLV